jgi:hypothetical protein
MKLLCHLSEIQLWKLHVIVAVVGFGEMVGHLEQLLHESHAKIFMSFFLYKEDLMFTSGQTITGYSDYRNKTVVVE